MIEFASQDCDPYRPRKHPQVVCRPPSLSPDLCGCLNYNLMSQTAAQIVLTDLDCRQQPIEIRQGCYTIFRCTEDGWEGQPCAGCPCGAVQVGRIIDISGGNSTYTLLHNAMCVGVDLAKPPVSSGYNDRTCFILDSKAKVCFLYNANSTKSII